MSLRQPGSSRGYAVRLCTLLLLCGCGGLATRAQTVRTYQIVYDPPDPSARRLDVCLIVADAPSAILYDREPIVYREGANAIGAYHYHRWAAQPGKLIAELLVRDLSQSGLYTAVSAAPSPIKADYILHTRLDEIGEAVGPEGCLGRVRWNIILTRTRAGVSPVIYQKSYAAEQASACAEPGRLVQTIGQLSAGLSAEIRSDLANAIERDLESMATKDQAP